MPLLLILAFVVVPILELFVVIEVGSAIGAGWTVVLLVADSVLGAWLLRREGARAWREFRAALGDGRWPGDEVAHGALVLVGGTLLLTPGFITDIVGFVLLLRPGRRLLLALVRPRILGPRWAQWASGGASTSRAASGRRPQRSSTSARGDILDIDVVHIERDEPPAPGELDHGDERPHS